MTTTTEIANQHKTQPQKTEITIKYGWWNTIDKTWYVSNTKKDFMPKGSRLLLKLEGEHTSEAISISGAQPLEGDVLACIDGKRFRVSEVSYA